MEDGDAVPPAHASAQVIQYYPVALDLRNRPCLVVGGGSVAEAKVDGLLASEARVTVVSPELTAGLAAWACEGRIAHRPREYHAEDLDGQQLVFAATDRRAVTEVVTADARRRGVWVNAADDPAFCDFLLPAVLRRGRLTVAVSTGGASPALASRVRNDLEAHLPPEYEELVELAAEVRAECRARAFRPGAVVWRGALERDLVDVIAAGKRGEARARLLERLGATA